MNKKKAVALVAATFSLVALQAVAQTPAGEKWDPAGRAAEAFTGSVIVSPKKITFQNGKSMALAAAGTTKYINDMKQTVTANVYRVIKPEDPNLGMGNKFCSGKNVEYFLTWRSPEQNDRQLAVFSGATFVSGSPDDCGRYGYFPH